MLQCANEPNDVREDANMSFLIAYFSISFLFAIVYCVIGSRHRSRVGVQRDRARADHLGRELTNYHTSEHGGPLAGVSNHLSRRESIQQASDAPAALSAFQQDGASASLNHLRSHILRRLLHDRCTLDQGFVHRGDLRHSQRILRRFPQGISRRLGTETD